MQLEQGEAYAERIGLPVLRSLVDGKSRMYSDRRSYQAMLADAERGQFSHLVVVLVDRIARDEREFVNTCHHLMDLGIEIHDTRRGKLRRAP
jgi:DNA invertase Pin-like site-specific DNA recombinase